MKKIMTFSVVILSILMSGISAAAVESKDPIKTHLARLDWPVTHHQNHGQRFAKGWL